MKSIVVFLTVFVVALLYGSPRGAAQEYKLRQVMDMKTTKMESIVYVKGKRQRTESIMVGMPAHIAVIEQCDLKRTITLNVKRQLYYIEPYETTRIQPPKSGKEPVVAKEEKVVKKGGVITIWTSIRDTGERKKMFGFTARHVWTSQKMKPSPDACSMKDSMLRKTDGWYIDLPLYECRRSYKLPADGGYGAQKPDCEDKYVTHSTGKGKLGFPLQEKSTIIMGDGAQVIETTIETLELSTAKLDTMLFTIPPGYQRVSKQEDLYDPADMGAMMKDAMEAGDEPVVSREQKAPGKIRIGVFAPTGSDEVQAGALQKHLVSTINNRNIEAIAVSSEEEAKQYYCDYTLNTVFSTIKPESTVGGVIKAIRKRDPALTKTYNIQGTLTLQAVKDGTEKARQSVDGKYEGNIDEAASKALDEASGRVLKGLK